MASWASIVASGQGSGQSTEVDSISDEERAEASRLVRGDRLCIEEEMGVDCLSRWKFGLVGRFLRGTQPIAVIRAALRFYWGKLRRFEVLQASEGAWLILFESEPDLLWALHHGPWAICGAVLFLERWNAGFDFSSPVQTRVPVWVLFPDLPMSLKTRNVVIALASRVGKPISLDPATLTEGHAREARVKVLCDLADPVLEGTYVEVNGFSFWQRYKYGGFARPCHKCGLIGHSQLVCHQGAVGPKRGRSMSRRKHLKSSSRGFSAEKPTDPQANLEAELEEDNEVLQSSDRATSAGRTRDLQVDAEDGKEKGIEADGSPEIVIHLTGSEEAELTVGEGIGNSNIEVEADTPPEGARASHKENNSTVKPHPTHKETPGDFPCGSDSDEEAPATHAASPRTGAVDAGKVREGRATHSLARGPGHRPIREESDISSESSDSGGDCKEVGAGNTGKARIPINVQSVTRETRRSKNNAEGPSAADLFRAAGAMEGLKVKARKNPKVAKATTEL